MKARAILADVLVVAAAVLVLVLATYAGKWLERAPHHHDGQSCGVPFLSVTCGSSGKW